MFFVLSVLCVTIQFDENISISPCPHVAKFGCLFINRFLVPWAYIYSRQFNCTYDLSTAPITLTYVHCRYVHPIHTFSELFAHQNGKNLHSAPLQSISTLSFPSSFALLLLLLLLLFFCFLFLFCFFFCFFFFCFWFSCFSFFFFLQSGVFILYCQASISHLHGNLFGVFYNWMPFLPPTLFSHLSVHVGDPQVLFYSDLPIWWNQS